MGFPGGVSGKELPASAEDVRATVLMSGLGRSPGGAWQPAPVFFPGEFCGQRSLLGYSPWDCKELDTAEAT